MIESTSSVWANFPVGYIVTWLFGFFCGLTASLAYLMSKYAGQDYYKITPLYQEVAQGVKE